MSGRDLGPRPLRVLLVEDDPAQLAEIRRALEVRDCRVATAESAEAAFRLCRPAAFDVILTDNLLPGMTGLQALPRFRASAARVIVMSTQFGPDLEEDARLLGAAAFLRKPLAATELDRLIGYGSWRPEPRAACLNSSRCM